MSNAAISNQDRRWMEAALRFAEKSNFPIYHMCCIFVKSGRVISVGLNRMSPGILKNTKYNKKAIHSELDAAIGLDKNAARKSKCYIAGISRIGNIIKSKPCPICEAFLAELGVKKAFYYNKDKSIGVIEF